MHSLAMAGMFPLLRDKLAVVSDVLNKGYLNGLQPRPPYIPPSLSAFDYS